MLMNMVEVCASLSATTFKNASGQSKSLSGPALHLFDLRAAMRNLSTPNLPVYRAAWRAKLAVRNSRVSRDHASKTHHQQVARECIYMTLEEYRLSPRLH